MTNVVDDEQQPAWRVVRARDGWVGGVCSGLAAASGVDVALVRLAFVLAGPSGIGATVYVLLWAFSPRGGSKGVADPQLAPESTASMIRLLLIVGAAVGALGGLWFFDPFPWDDPGSLLGLALIGLGVAWLVRRGTTAGPDAAAPPTSPAPSSSPPPPVPAWSPPSPSPLPPPIPAPEPPATSSPARPAPALDATLGMAPPPTDGAIAAASAREPRGRAGDLVLAVVMWLAVLGTIGLKLVVGALVLFEAIDLPAAGLLLFLSTVALLAMIISAVRRRALLFGLSVAMIVALLGVGTIVASFNGDVGRTTERITSLDRLAGHYENAIGHMRLDMSTVDFAGTTRQVVIEQGIGRTDLVVPDDVTIEFTHDVQMGELVLFDDTSDVWSDSGSVLARGREGAGTLRVDAEIGAGSLRLCRAAAADLGDIACPSGS